MILKTLSDILKFIRVVLVHLNQNYYLCIKKNGISYVHFVGTICGYGS